MHSHCFEFCILRKPACGQGSGGLEIIFTVLYTLLLVLEMLYVLHFYLLSQRLDRVASHADRDAAALSGISGRSLSTDCTHLLGRAEVFKYVYDPCGSSFTSIIRSCRRVFPDPLTLTGHQERLPGIGPLGHPPHAARKEISRNERAFFRPLRR